MHLQCRATPLQQRSLNCGRGSSAAAVVAPAAAAGLLRPVDRRSPAAAQQQHRRQRPRLAAAPGASPTVVTETAADAAAGVEAPPSPADAAGSSPWMQFAAAASGEWDGVTATFDPDGTPQQLPQHYVPEAFREWGVELFDWQQQCSSVADSTTQRFRSVVRRLMPTVGCEADAIAFTEDDACSSTTAAGAAPGSNSDSSSGAASGPAPAVAPVLTCAADGSYSSGPAQLPATGTDTGPSKFSVEHCLVLPAAHAAAVAAAAAQKQTDRPTRIKVVQTFRKDWSSGGWVLASVDLHKERYDGPYTGKRELAGCGGGEPGIAQLPALQQQQLAGTWAADSSSSSSAGQQRLSCLDAAGGAPAGAQLTLLPLRAWSAVHLSEEGQLQRAEAGVVLMAGEAESPPGARLVSARVYAADGGALEHSSLGQERLQAAA